MKGRIGGLVVGVVLGIALAGAAQGTWISAEMMLKKGSDGNEFVRIGYIEGVSDTLGAVAAMSVPASFWQKNTACLSVHQHGSLGEFMRWADGVWQSNVNKGHGDANAAGLLIADACK